ncbi:hypothetical protein SAMN05216316_1956 [Nitrosovibrio sp. Nv6]|nr:hypothetical protein SAMN05216316_1956 [Nitrosovibrio sp. Nv6]
MHFSSIFFSFFAIIGHVSGISGTSDTARTEKLSVSPNGVFAHTNRLVNYTPGGMVTLFSKEAPGR